jgi:zinc transport system permease protein
MTLLELLQYPFMQRALIAGLILGFLLALMGVFVVLRRISFFGDGIAHASLAGIAIGILASQNPFPVAIGFAVVFASLIFFLERRTTLGADAIIGTLFPAAMALGVVLISLKSGYQPDLLTFLFGNILTIKSSDLLVMSVFAVLATVFVAALYKQIVFSAFDRDGAEVAGIHTSLLDFLFYVTLAVTVVLGVKVLGVILISALLVIPVSTSAFIAKSLRGLVWYSIFLSEGVVVGGLVVSYVLNLPTGATIVLLGTAVFFTVMAGKKVLGFRLIT